MFGLAEVRHTSQLFLLTATLPCVQTQLLVILHPTFISLITLYETLPCDADERHS